MLNTASNGLDFCDKINKNSQILGQSMLISEKSYNENEKLQELLIQNKFDFQAVSEKWGSYISPEELREKWTEIEIRRVN